MWNSTKTTINDEKDIKFQLILDKMASNLISLHSDDGKKLVDETKSGHGFFQNNLFQIFHKQTTGFTCGVVSSSMVMSAKTGRTADLPYTESNLFSFPETTSAITWEKLEHNTGMTLDELGSVLSSHGCEVKVIHASESTPENLRKDAKEALSSLNSDMGIIVNYKQDVLGQGVTYGHISPLCGYHVPTDRLLILDTWPETEECWAKVDDLYRSMSTVDKDSGKTRGYVTVKVKWFRRQPLIG